MAVWLWNVQSEYGIGCRPLDVCDRGHGVDLILFYYIMLFMSKENGKKMESRFFRIHTGVSLQFGSNSFYPKFLKTDRKPRYARQERNQTLGRAKRKGVGGNEFLPALAFPPPPNFVPTKLARHLLMKAIYSKEVQLLIR